MNASDTHCAPFGQFFTHTIQRIHSVSFLEFINHRNSAKHPLDVHGSDIIRAMNSVT